MVLYAALSGAVDSAYQQGAEFLRARVGLENPSIIARTLDVAMNPNSLFVSFRDKKRSKNANVSRPVGFRLQYSAACMFPVRASGGVMFYLDTTYDVVLQARRLSVEDDMEPVVAFLEVQGLTTQQISSVVTEHPPVLSYSIPERLQPLLQYLNSVSVQDVPAVRSHSGWVASRSIRTSAEAGLLRFFALLVRACTVQPYAT